MLLAFCISCACCTEWWRKGGSVGGIRCLQARGWAMVGDSLDTVAKMCFANEVRLLRDGATMYETTSLFGASLVPRQCLCSNEAVGWRREGGEMVLA